MQIQFNNHNQFHNNIYMNQDDKPKFKSAMQEEIKILLRNIRTNYFHWLNSLKFENIPDKKSDKGFFMRGSEQNEEISEISQISHIMAAEYHFEDEMAV